MLVNRIGGARGAQQLPRFARTIQPQRFSRLYLLYLNRLLQSVLVSSDRRGTGGCSLLVAIEEVQAVAIEEVQAAAAKPFLLQSVLVSSEGVAELGDASIRTFAPVKQVNCTRCIA
jgi:hypothetical protein